MAFLTTTASALSLFSQLFIASVPDGEAVRRVRVRKEAAHAEYP